MPSSFCWPPGCCGSVSAIRLPVRSGCRADLCDDSTQLRIPLDTDHRYDIDTGYYTIHLVVENGGIRFVESPCPDHTCESFGVLTKQGDWAACLPARASVTVE